MGKDVVRITGAKQLRLTLKKAGADLQDLKQVHQKVAAVVVPIAAATAPFGPAPTHIRDTVRAGATQRAAIVRVGKKSLPYAGAIHYGWYKRGIKANPWVYQAAKSTEQKWTGIYTTGVTKIIDQVEGA